MKFYPCLIVVLLLPGMGQACEGSGACSGSGFFVNKEYIVTNAHVVKGCSKVTLKSATPVFEASVEEMDEAQDLALLKTTATSPNIAPMRFDIDTLYPGSKVFIIGYPGREGARGIPKFVEAEVPTLPAKMENPYSRFYITDKIEHGDSGGPVFDSYGNIVGVMVATSGYSQYNKKTGERISEKLGVVINLNTLKEFMSAHSVYTQWVGSGSLTVDPSIEEDAKKFIVNIHCRTSP